MTQAYQNNPSLEAERAKLRVTDEDVSQALSHWRPTIDATTNVGKTYQNIPAQKVYGTSDFADTTRGYGVQVTQPIFRGFRTSSETKAAEKEVMSGRAKLQAAEQKLLLDTATAFLDTMRDEAVLSYDSENEDVLRKKLEEVTVRSKVGDLTQTDIHQAESRLARAQVSRAQAENALSADRSAYTRLTALRTYVFSHTTSRIDVELGARLFRHLVALPIAYFETRRAGDSVARVRELDNIRNFITSSALTLVIDLLFTFVFLAVMAYYSVFLTFVVLASFPFYIGISVFVTPIFRQRLTDKFNRGAENQAFLVESITGIETLKAMAVEPQMQRRWEEQLAGYIKSSFRVLSIGNWASQFVQLVSKLTTAATLFFGAQAVINGDMTVGQLVAFNMLAGRVAQPVLRLAQMWQDFHQAKISVDRLGDILNTTPEPMFTPSRTGLPDIKGSISFEHVGFRYKIDGPEILHDVKIAIQPGQVVGIVGPSGSGKSTLTKLVQRLYVPESGRVLIDGVDLTMVDVSWLRRQVGVVLQENVLFNRSIRDNIALADPGMPIERVMAAAKLAGAHDFILELPQGYDTNVGERGSGLSGGQRQRIAIARALVMNPRILIFDEATSALDYESERIIQENMRQIVQGRTVLIIAHRLSAVRNAHRIITIEKGRVVEDGTHDTLIRSGGRYASLWLIQGGGHAAQA